MQRLISTIVLTISILFLALPVFAQDDATPEVTPEATELAEPECFVSTGDTRTIRVRVGPGENRTSVTFLPEDVDVPVIGQTEDDDGNLWYQVDKEIAAPGRAINEAWIAADNDALETEGDCEDIADASAPPIIPIINQPTPSPEDDTVDSDENTDDSEETVVEGTSPLDGTWTLSWSGTTNVSCVGTENVTASTNEIFGRPGVGLLPITSSVININRADSQGVFMFMFTPMYPQGNGTYRGEVTFVDTDGTFLPSTVVVNSASSNQMSGYLTINAGDCSGTVTFTATL